MFGLKVRVRVHVRVTIFEKVRVHVRVHVRDTGVHVRVTISSWHVHRTLLETKFETRKRHPRFTIHDENFRNFVLNLLLLDYHFHFKYILDSLESILGVTVTRSHHPRTHRAGQVVKSFKKSVDKSVDT